MVFCFSSHVTSIISTNPDERDKCLLQIIFLLKKTTPPLLNKEGAKFIIFFSSKYLPDTSGLQQK